MDYIAGIKEVAIPTFRIPLNLQLFAEDDDSTPTLEDTPEYKEDSRKYEQMNAKIDKFNAERAPKEPVKEFENKLEKEPVTLEEEAGTKEVATPTDKPKQDKETNDAFQEQRKAREAAEAKAKVLEEKAAKADALIKAQFGNQGINTVEQYEQWIKEGEEQADNDRYREAGLKPEEIEKLKGFDLLKAETEKQVTQQLQQEYLSQWDALYKAYPDIAAEAEAFREGKDPSFYTAEMKAEILRGASPLAAYRNAHFETILANATKGTKEIAKQEAIDQLNSKNHIKPNATLGGDVEHVEIDPEQWKIYKGLMKGKSDADIRKFAKKQLAGG